MLLERDTLGSGSTGRSSGIIRMHYSTEVNARLAWESLHIFKDFASIVGGDSVEFVRTGYMVIVPEDSIDGLRQNISMQQAVGIETQIVSLDEARELAPMFHLGETEAFAWESESGHGDPSGTALAIARAAAEGKGGAFTAPRAEKELLPNTRGGELEGVSVHSARMPGRIAHHELVFGALGQTLTIRHDSINRESFMPGVTLAIREVVKRTGLTVGLDKIMGL